MNTKKIIARLNPALWPKALKVAVIVILLSGIGFGVYSKVNPPKSSKNYRTAVVSKGTLVTAISATGTITSSNKTSITTGATGVIKKVYVKNGDTVIKGQKIAEIVLDDEGIANQTIAWANYVSTLQSQNESIVNQQASDIQMWKDRQTVLDATEEYNNMVAGGWNPKTNKEYTYNEKAIVSKTLEEAKLTFSADESKYNNYSAFIAKAKQTTATAYKNYQKVSSTIYAPAAGVINNLSITEGVIISNYSDTITVSTGTNSSENSASVVSHTIGGITNSNGQYQATLSLTESDIVKIKSGQKVTLTMEAFENTTFTGKVLSVDVSGSTNSGVTSYSVVVLLDNTDKEIYTGMTVSANIITSSKSDIIIIPSAAIDTANNGISTVRTLNNGVLNTVTVTVGSTNNSETEILSGLNVGDTIITTSAANEALFNNNSSSVFSSGSNRSGTNQNTNRSGNSGFGGAMMIGPPGM